MENKITRCSYCGEDAEVCDSSIGIGRALYQVRCTWCASRGMSFKTKADAISAWNKINSAAIKENNGVFDSHTDGIVLFVKDEAKENGNETR